MSYTVKLLVFALFLNSLLSVTGLLFPLLVIPEILSQLHDKIQEENHGHEPQDFLMVKYNISTVTETCNYLKDAENEMKKVLTFFSNNSTKHSLLTSRLQSTGLAINETCEKATLNFAVTSVRSPISSPMVITSVPLIYRPEGLDKAFKLMKSFNMNLVVTLKKTFVQDMLNMFEIFNNNALTIIGELDKLNQGMNSLR